MKKKINETQQQKLKKIIKNYCNNKVSQSILKNECGINLNNNTFTNENLELLKNYCIKK